MNRIYFIYMHRLAYSLCNGWMSITLDLIADVTNRCSRPYDLEGIDYILLKHAIGFYENNQERNLILLGGVFTVTSL